jgi:hypothetical protein
LSGPDALNRDRPDLPLPRRALLAANLRARAAAGGCFRACSSWHVYLQQRTEPLRAPVHRPFETFAEVCCWRAQGGSKGSISSGSNSPPLAAGLFIQASPVFRPLKLNLRFANPRPSSNPSENLATSRLRGSYPCRRPGASESRSPRSSTLPPATSSTHGEVEGDKAGTPR